MVEYRGALTEDDHVEVVRLCKGIIPSVSGANDSVLLFCIGFTVLALWGYFGGPEPNAESLWWLVFAVPALVWWWLRRPQPRKQWRNTPALREEYRGRVTTEALETYLGTDARIPWQLFSGHAASATVIVLFLGTLYIPLSKVFFRNQQDWEDATATIQQRVSTGGAKRPSVLRTIVLWLVLLLVVFLAWHFAQFPRPE